MDQLTLYILIFIAGDIAGFIAGYVLGKARAQSRENSLMGAPRNALDTPPLAASSRYRPLPDDRRPTPHDGIGEDIRLLAQNGKKIEAIKLLRDRTGIGLKEAKEAVERIM